jgi:SAM-dependent methyltransferase
MPSRREFLDQRRAITRQRFDELHAPIYDENWGHVNPSHAAFVDRLIALVPPGGRVLDAACGTGKYWPALLAAGLGVVGVDQSRGMLDRGTAKHPGVETRVLALQELGAATGLHGSFDGLICVDAMEYVGPEDWPVVLAGLRAMLRPGAPAYLTVELPEEPVPLVEGLEPGEHIAGGGYHYYPTDRAVDAWLAGAGFAVTADEVGDGYRHLLVRCP